MLSTGLGLLRHAMKREKKKEKIKKKERKKAIIHWQVTNKYLQV